MRATFDTYMIMCIIFFVQIMINSHIFHIDEANNRPFKTLNDLKMQQKSTQNKKKSPLLQISFN